MLTFKGEKEEQKEEKQKDYHISERRFSSFQRSFELPEGIDEDKIQANFEKGVLTIKLPKCAEAQVSRFGLMHCDVAAARGELGFCDAPQGQERHRPEHCRRANYGLLNVTPREGFQHTERLSGDYVKVKR